MVGLLGSACSSTTVNHGSDDDDAMGGQAPSRAGSAAVSPEGGEGGTTPLGGDAGESSVGGAEAAGGQGISPLGPAVVARSGALLTSQSFRLRVSVGPLSPAPLRSAHFRLMLAAQPIDGGTK